MLGYQAYLYRMGKIMPMLDPGRQGNKRETKLSNGEATLPPMVAGRVYEEKIYSATANSPSLHTLSARIRLVFNSRPLIMQLTRREIALRYQGSFFGILWSFLTPLLMLSIYSFVFGVIFGSRWPNPHPFPLDNVMFLFCNLTAFNVISELWNVSPFLIIGNPNYVKKVVFPLELLPLIQLLNILFHTLINFSILIVALLIFRHSLPLSILFLPLAMIPMIIFAMAGALFFTSLGVYLRDIKNFIGIFTTVLFFMTPIFYPPISVANAAPGIAKFVINWNPLNHIIEMIRTAVVIGGIPSMSSYLSICGISILAFLAGFWLFEKLRPGFSDVL